MTQNHVNKISMTFMLFNVQNLFIPPYTIHRDYGNPPPKNIEKVKEIARLILEQNPHVIMLTEVGGEDSLKNFNHSYLKDNYIESMIQGNSDRGIELAFLIKKELPYRYEQYTHRNRPLDFSYPQVTKPEIGHTHYLSRDIAELRFYNDSAHEQTAPCLIILLVHLKSKLDKEGLDPEGRKRREAEVKLVIETYNILNNRYEKKVPIFLAGDFNGNASNHNTDKEFLDLYNKTDLQDFMELIKIPHEERFSFVHFSEHYKGEKQQLDYMFIPPELTSSIIKEESGVFRFLDEKNILLPIPTNRSMLYSLPSDHYPLFLKLKKII